MVDPLVSVVEIDEFIAATRKLMSEADRAALVDYLAGNPLAGDLIAGTGGVRKLRWALEGRGRRVIYFFHSEKLPLFIFTMYAKNVRSDLSDADRNELKTITKSIVESYRKGVR
ncbi:MAG: hypothetical protein WDM86_19160 [Rhizomicrobium sp.]